MTRINCILVEELCDKHLLAEYHEITRVFKLARQPRLLEQFPKEYTLGKGHVKFFYDKLVYINERTKQLIKELVKRGFEVRLTIADFEYNRRVHMDKVLWNDWVPTKKAMALNRERIALRISQFKRASSANRCHD